jgi:Ca2+-binding EF-hand superfamily protein
MKKTLVLLALTVSAPAAFAGDPASKFAKLDADGDGKLSKDEFLGSSSIFERWDADKDGFVTQAEMTAGLAAPRKQVPTEPKSDRDPRKPRGENRPGEKGGETRVKEMLRRLDKNGDRKISEDEVPERAKAFFKKLDKNKDGVVDVAEMKSMQGAGRRRGGADWAKRIRTMDVDKNGSVSREEWKGRPDSFARLDSDKDGVLSGKEIDAFAKRATKRGGWKNRPGDALFRRLDVDKDKRISKAEWKLNPELFARFDANADGYISLDEVTPKTRGDEMPTGKMSEKFIRKYDKNKDGSVDATELGNEKRFAAMDRDGDGVLSRAEIDQAHDQARSERSLGFIPRFDKNKDGKVTREEFTGPARMFERLDADGDGVVREAEAK